MQFDNAIQTTENEQIEYWYARELMVVLEYGQWRNFKKVLDKARLSCELSNNKTYCNFADVSKIVKTGVSEKTVKDFKLSRYACYLIV